MAPLDALTDALVPGTLIRHQDKVWRMGQVHRHGEALVGRLGFEASDVAELWDEQLNDFTEDSRATGLTSPFAIDVRTEPLRVAFQVRGRQIQANRFVQVLEALLNEASPTDRWRVHRERTAVSFDDWARDVDRVLIVRTALKRPNPHYADRERVRELVEGTKARMAEVILRVDDSDLQGLDVNDRFIREAIEHAQKSYGSFSALGERDGQQVQWSARDDGASEVRKVAADPATHDIDSRTLRHELGDPTVELEVFDEVRDAIAEAKSLDLEQSDEAFFLDDTDEYA